MPCRPFLQNMSQSWASLLKTCLRRDSRCSWRELLSCILPDCLWVVLVPEWVCHGDFHATFDPVKRDRRTRPRCVVHCICDAAAGKSPFWRGFSSPFFNGCRCRKVMFWASPECWLMLDTAHAKKGAEASQDKINFHYLLECQKIFNATQRKHHNTCAMCHKIFM